MLAAKLSFRWPQCARTDLKKIIPSANADGIDLMAATLAWDPKRRPLGPQVSPGDVRFDRLSGWFQCMKHPYFKVSQDTLESSTGNIGRANEPNSMKSAGSRDSKQIFTEDWQTEGVSDERNDRAVHTVCSLLQQRTPASPADMNDLDALLKEFEHPTKASKAETRAAAQPAKATKPSSDFSFESSPISQKPVHPPLPKFDSSRQSHIDLCRFRPALI